MSKTITIPNLGPDPLIVTIGTESYRYPVGTSQTVPDDVAEVIALAAAEQPKHPKRVGDVTIITVNGGKTYKPGQIQEIAKRASVFLQYDGDKVAPLELCTSSSAYFRVGDQRYAVSAAGVVTSVDMTPPEIKANVSVTDEDTPLKSLQIGDDKFVCASKIVEEDYEVVSDDWASNSKYSADGYIYRAKIAITGVKSSMFAIVCFAPGDAASGNYAPVAETTSGGVYIYSKVNTAIEIPTIFVIV